MEGAGGSSCTGSTMYFLWCLSLNVQQICLYCSNSNSTAFGQQNVMILYGPSHGCCSHLWEMFWFAYADGRSYKLDIMWSPASRVRHLHLLFEHTICLSCVSQRWTWAFSREHCNNSMNAVPSSRWIPLCCDWPPKNTDGRYGVNHRSRLNGLQSVSVCIDILYADCPGGSILSNWSW
jgi:hypothetical protein